MEIETTIVAFIVKHCATAPRRSQIFYGTNITNTVAAQWCKRVTVLSSIPTRGNELLFMDGKRSILTLGPVYKSRRREVIKK